MSTDNFMNGMPHTKGTAISNFLAYCRLLKEKENPVHAERKPYSNMNSMCLSSCSKVLQFNYLCSNTSVLALQHVESFASNLTVS